VLYLLVDAARFGAAVLKALTAARSSKNQKRTTIPHRAKDGGTKQGMLSAASSNIAAPQEVADADRRDEAKMADERAWKISPGTGGGESLRHKAQGR
jgi:hypothetical protein